MKPLSLLLSLLVISFLSFSQGRNISQTTKKIVYSRDGGRCQCCGGYESLEYDHITPFSCGGSSDASNIQLLCRTCNRSKSNSCYCKVHNRKVGTNCCDSRSGGSSSTYSNSSSVSTQCTSTTKKGLRCRKMTKSPNGRCHLHQ